ncbi:MAG TPA: class III extradiol dioxygenase family protein [Gammaproteobacteria bacterium]|nr:class III extradiol dioxygenase family protein [Gammaproteobacteria bacterium]
MAQIVGGVITSHIPAIGNAITNKLQEDPYWKPLFDGYAKAREWMESVEPDIVVVVYNDHGLNFFLDKMPTFAIGAASEYHNADEGWGLATLHSFEGDIEFSWHLIEKMIPAGIDLTICQEMLIDHGFIVPMSVMWSHLPAWPVKAVPFAVNTVLMPVPTAQRCFDVGVELGKAIASYPEDKKVVIFGTGGMSHQLSGERAGFINKQFDRAYMDKIIDRPEELCRLTHTELIQQAGAEGIELIMWLVMRGALGKSVNVVHRNYELPISNTGSGIMVMEQA